MDALLCSVESSVCTIRIPKCAWKLYISHCTASFSVYFYCKHKQPCFAFSGYRTNIHTFLLSILTSSVPLMEALHDIDTIKHKVSTRFELATKKSLSNWTWKLAKMKLVLMLIAMLYRVASTIFWQQRSDIIACNLHVTEECVNNSIASDACHLRQGIHSF